MVGSWAGAMGHTQFMPSAFTNYAIDGDGDGQVNLWSSEEDALSSAANFLANLGWEAGYRWGREVQLPTDFDYQQSGYKNRQSLSEWHAQGIKRANGSELGEGETSAYVIVPAGHQGPAFIAYKNFRVIMRWNNSEFYAIAVGVLADKIAGASGIKAPLPDLPAYSRKDIIALQSKLNALGFDVGKPDGIIGPATREGIRNYQIANKMIADGFPGLDVMAALDVTLERNKAKAT
jgi:membrane-bound lytic murein transglycosylase B